MFNVYALLLWLAFFRPTFPVIAFSNYSRLFPFCLSASARRWWLLLSSKNRAFLLSTKFLLLRKRNWLSLKMSHKKWRKYLSFDLENCFAQLSILTLPVAVAANVKPEPSSLSIFGRHSYISKIEASNEQPWKLWRIKFSFKKIAWELRIQTMLRPRENDNDVFSTDFFFVLSSFYIVGIIARILLDCRRRFQRLFSSYSAPPFTPPHCRFLSWKSESTSIFTF